MVALDARLGSGTQSPLGGVGLVSLVGSGFASEVVGSESRTCVGRHPARIGMRVICNVFSRAEEIIDEVEAADKADRSRSAAESTSRH